MLNQIIEYRKTSWVSGIFKSFNDAPDGLSEELKEFTWALGANIGTKTHLHYEWVILMKNELKGARKYFYLLGLDLNTTLLKSMCRICFLLQQLKPIENTLRFSLTFNFGDKYDELNK